MNQPISGGNGVADIHGGRKDSIAGIRVALVVNDSRMGGSERQALLLALEMKRRGLHPMLLGLAGPGEVLDKAREQGVETDAIRLWYPLSPWYFPVNLIRAGWFLRRHRPQVILGYTSVPNLYVGWLWRWTGARAFVWSERNAGIVDRPPAFLEGVALQSASALIANAPSGIDFLARELPKGPSPKVLVPNGVAVPAERDLGSGTFFGKLQVLCVAHGRSPKKDHETLLKAWRQVVSQQALGGVQPTLVLAGYFEQGDPYTDRIRSMASHPDLNDTVRFVGMTDSIKELLKASAIGVLSSRSEGMPNAVLEYMASGLPVVATDLPGIRLALGDEAGHWLVPVGDAGTLANRLLELLRDRSLRLEWGKRGRERALREFSVAAMTDATLAVIREALA